MINRSEYLLNRLAETAEEYNTINPKYYDLYDVKRGLRNKNGTGVLVGLTEIGSVHGYLIEEDEKLSVEGKLFYRGIELRELVTGFQSDKRFGFEECAYLLLLGKLPTSEQLADFNTVLGEFRSLPNNFTENFLLKLPSKDIMNQLQRSVLFLYSEDDKADHIDIRNLLEQSIKLIARFPTILAYGYQAKVHNFNNKSLFIHSPKKELSTAENILHMSRSDSKYSKTEAEVLDLCLVIHAEHGGGNNSAFATHVVSSSGTDTYSAISSAIGCLKGPKHGGANKMVKKMVDDIKLHVKDFSNEKKLKDYLRKILKKEAFNKQGLIYGMGHAVYTLSDPRSELLRDKAEELAKEKGYEKEFNLYKNIEKLTKELFIEIRGKNAVICSNVDLYSGLVYEMLNIPEELFTPLFAAARVTGWCAHRIEQIMSDKKIIRPAYKNVSPISDYTEISDR